MTSPAEQHPRQADPSAPAAPDCLSLLAEADTGLLNPGWAGSPVAQETSDAAFLRHMLQVEAAWTAVLAEHGLATAEQAEAAEQACDPSAYDLVALAHAGHDGGNPLIPALKALREHLSGVAGASGAVHVGATSQDIIDTALMRMTTQVTAAILRDVRAAVGSLVELARTHRQTPMVARSLAQHSLPSTFGLRAANWLDGLAQAGRRLETATAELPLQWGGAAGTMAALSVKVAEAHRQGIFDDGTGTFQLIEALAARLGLSTPAGPWDTNRMPVTGVAAALADVVAACGKIANDVLISARIENGELGEPLVAGRGGSSAMPHKQNPVLSVLIHSSALSAPGALAQVYTAAGAANEERPDGAWHTEWPALRQLLRTAGGTAARTAELVAGLRVHEDRMRENLHRTGPLLVSERLMSELAPRIEQARGGEPGSGKKRIQAIVDRSLSAAHAAENTGGSAPENSADFRTLLREAALDTVSDEDLETMLDPANYIGEATALVDRITQKHEEWSRA